ncbi:MAG: 3-phosphoshikimate 1-carboxyvinyltransferase [Cyclobacteriaceae bacterium]|nr:3-phosphoshikimate 1-carboxyvinyltransferase [Cyclobacteriaceae bacterium]
MSFLKTTHLQGNVRSLPSSKSLSNRALIIRALANQPFAIENISSARDTQLMAALVNSSSHLIDVMDAGTTMRFLTAYFGVTGQSKTLTGTARMKERPIHLLVNALRQLGVTIRYVEKEGFPPIEVGGFTKQNTRELAIRGDVSSQFISALMMIAHVLPEGLTILLEGKIGSKPYIHMTGELMRYFGAQLQIEASKIVIQPGKYSGKVYTVEPDWSAASYWFAIVALAEEASIVLPGVKSESLQGDRAIVDIMQPLGVLSEFKPEGLSLKKTQISATSLSWDFSDCPDLAQTVLPVCAALQVKGRFTGLESLRVKETDRIAALQNELKKIGAELSEEGSEWVLTPGPAPKASPVFHTYHDHRMAMGFAPLATRMNITIEDSSVVKKSYPTFWDDLKAIGFKVVP